MEYDYTDECMSAWVCACVPSVAIKCHATKMKKKKIKKSEGV